MAIELILSDVIFLRLDIIELFANIKENLKPAIAKSFEYDFIRRMLSYLEIKSI